MNRKECAHAHVFRALVITAPLPRARLGRAPCRVQARAVITGGAVKVSGYLAMMRTGAAAVVFACALVGGSTAADAGDRGSADWDDRQFVRRWLYQKYQDEAALRRTA